jgi:hypothetical protein
MGQIAWKLPVFLCTGGCVVTRLEYPLQGAVTSNMRGAQNK